MAKKKKPAPKKRSLGAIPLVDKTAQRKLESQLSKIAALGTEGKFEEALELLEPLMERYPEKVEVLELAALAYRALREYDLALSIYLQIYDLNTAASKYVLRSAFNLALAEMDAGFPISAFNRISKLTFPALDKDSRGSITPIMFREARQSIQEVVANLEKSQTLPHEQFINFNLAMESGFIALLKNDGEKAIAHYEEAAKIDPTSIEPYTKIAVAKTMVGKPDEAVTILKDILEKRAPGDFSTMITLVRLLLLEDRHSEAAEYLAELQKMPMTDPEHRISLGGVLGLFEDDQAVYDLIYSFVAESTPLWDELSEDRMSEAFRLGIVSAANLGKLAEAEAVYDQIDEEPDDIILLRTFTALMGGEEGPRPGGRFFYDQPPLLYAPVLTAFIDLLKSAPTESLSMDAPEVTSFMAKNGKKMLEIGTFNCWVGTDIEGVQQWLSQMQRLEPPAGLEQVNRFAFTRAGSDILHILALGSLIQAGHVDKESPATIWLEGEQTTGTYEELVERLIESESEDFDEDEDQDEDEDE